MMNQCRKPSGWLGRFVLWQMNQRHSGVTDWGLSHIAAGTRDNILDAGCGGGRTVNKLAAKAVDGKVTGVDFSKASIAAATKYNADLIAAGRVEIVRASVSELPFPDATFDLVTAVETHFWWPNPTEDIKEVFRVVKPGGTTIFIAEIYQGAKTKISEVAEKYLPLSGMKLLTVEEHQQLFENAGYTDVRVTTEASKGWICAVGKRPQRIIQNSQAAQ
jgi:SAM-dependent methyltransferase